MALRGNFILMLVATLSVSIPAQQTVAESGPTASGQTAVAGPALTTSGQKLALDRLQEFFARTNGLRADFSQQVTDNKGNIIHESSGVLSLQRPGKFRWDYKEPYQQLILADGQRVWIYDVDLQQATVKAQQQALASTPAQLLSGASFDTKQFVITELGKREGLQWLRLESKDADVPYRHIELAFDGQELKIMQLIDGFGQTTRLTFSSQEHNPVFDRELFVFIPPDGVDVIGE